jgi:chromosome partitioning protein
MRVTTINAGKGGVSKSTTAWVLATWLCKQGYKPLVIDYEPNANLTAFMGGDYRNSPTMYHVYNHEVDIVQAIQHTPLGYVIAGNTTLNKILFMYMNDIMNGIEALKRQMPKLEESGFTHVIIDNQPLVGDVKSLQATTAANDMVITLHPDMGTLQGFINLVEGMAEAVRFNPALRIDGILLGRYRNTSPERFFAEQIAQWAKKVGTRVYRSIIREAIAVQNAQGNVSSIWDSCPQENQTRDFEGFIQEYMEGSKT